MLALALSRAADLRGVVASIEASLALLAGRYERQEECRRHIVRSERAIDESVALLDRLGHVTVWHGGFRIDAHLRIGGWQARLDGIAALSALYATARDAISEIERYLDDQALAPAAD